VAAETDSIATLDEQLFDHQRNAPIRSKSCCHPRPPDVPEPRRE
jgi:hypothetical protein